jgi:hypothetical protein
LRSCQIWSVFRVILLQISFLVDFFWQKGIIFLNWTFLLRNCQIWSVFRVILLQIHFGSGAAVIRIRNDFSGSVFGSCYMVWIRLDPTRFGSGSGSGATTLFIQIPLLVIRIWINQVPMLISLSIARSNQSKEQQHTSSLFNCHVKQENFLPWQQLAYYWQCYPLQEPILPQSRNPRKRRPSTIWTLKKVILW